MINIITKMSKEDACKSNGTRLGCYKTLPTAEGLIRISTPGGKKLPMGTVKQNYWRQC